MQSLSLELAQGPAQGPVHVADFGGQGRLIVLVHGIGGNHTNWWTVGPQLTALGRVVAVDLVGCGYTEPHRRQCRLTTNVQLVKEVVHQLGEPAVLVGHSMGGLLALLLAAREPALIEMLVLIDPSQRGESPRPNPQFLAQLLLPSVPVVGPAMLRRTVGPKTGAERIHDAWAVSMVDQSRVSAPARRAAIDMAEYWYGTSWHRVSVLTAIASTGRALVDPRRYEQAVDAARCPTMVIHGTQDHMISFRRIEKLARRRPDWQVNFIDDVGHNPHLEAGDHVVALIEGFLSGASSAGPNQR